MSANLNDSELTKPPGGGKPGVPSLVDTWGVAFTFSLLPASIYGVSWVSPSQLWA